MADTHTHGPTDELPVWPWRDSEDLTRIGSTVLVPSWAFEACTFCGEPISHEGPCVRLGVSFMLAHPGCFYGEPFAAPSSTEDTNQ